MVSPKKTALLLLSILINCFAVCKTKPTVDPGLFMILGVETCRAGSGYCLLGIDCTLDDDFLPDDSGGHCDGLKKAFTPSAHFTCCKENPDKPDKPTTRRPRPHPTSTTSSTTTQATDIKNSTTTTSLATDEPDVTTVQWNVTDIFVDLNNEVFKEVVPPALQDQSEPQIEAVQGHNNKS